MAPRRMSPELSRRAALAMQDTTIEAKQMILAAVEDKETIADVLYPVRGWIEEPSSVPEEYLEPGRF